MQLAQIKWIKRFENDLAGMVNNSLFFIIDKKGVRKVKYVLKSYPFENNVFTRANNYKILFEHTNLDKVKEKAQKYFQKYIALFMDKEDRPYSSASLVLLTIYHVQYNMQSGISLDPIDTLIDMAKSFEKEWNDSNRDWESSETDWENALIQHYNKHKDPRWDAIT